MYRCGYEASEDTALGARIVRYKRGTVLSVGDIPKCGVFGLVMIEHKDSDKICTIIYAD